eukprot:11935471-Ditylum_brightwellii.AAC.3
MSRRKLCADDYHREIETIELNYSIFLKELHQLEEQGQETIHDCEEYCYGTEHDSEEHHDEDEGNKGIGEDETSIV